MMSENDFVALYCDVRGTFWQSVAGTMLTNLPFGRTQRIFFVLAHAIGVRGSDTLRELWRSCRILIQRNSTLAEMTSELVKDTTNLPTRAHQN